MESRQRHGTCIIPVDELLEDLYLSADPTILITSTSIGDAANAWCLPPSPLWWSNAMIELQVKLYKTSVQMASKGLSFRLQAPTFVPLTDERPPGSIGLRRTSSGPTRKRTHARCGGSFPALTIT